MNALQDRRPSRRSGVWLRRAEHEIALVDPEAGSIHLLNNTAAAIWDLCDGETLPEEMVAAVCEISSMPEEVVSEDVGRVLTEFERAGVITWLEE